MHASTSSDLASQSANTSATDRWVRLAWWLTLAAIGLRIYHFLRNPAVWCDEIWILRNITDKTYIEQLGPLFDIQAAPPLFLWSERSIWLLFGDNIFALRSLPLLASCLGMLLLYRSGRLILSSAAIPWVIFIFGFSNNLVDYTCEVKPYVIDAFFALLVLWLFLETRSWRLGVRLLMFVAICPLVIFSSYPGCFVCGSLLTALLPSVWQIRRSVTIWAAYCFLTAVVFGSFALVYFGPIQAQRTDVLQSLWIDYPNWREPWTVPVWTAGSLFRLFEHFWRPTGVILVAPLAVGIWMRRRQSSWAELAMLLGPASLAFFAALLRKYPFESRLIVFVLPGICLLIGAGLAEITHWMRSRIEACEPTVARKRRAIGFALVIAFNLAILIPFGKTAYHLVVPIKRLWPEQWPPANRAELPVNSKSEAAWACRDIAEDVERGS